MARERRKAICANSSCEGVFQSVLDHGVWSKFCCRECFLSQGRAPRPRKCTGCRKVFDSPFIKGTTKTEPFCTEECKKSYQERAAPKVCINCGNMFTPRYPNSPKPQVCCDYDCRNSHFKGEVAAAWKGGVSDQKALDQLYLRVELPNYVGAYQPEQRVVASKAIGRQLIKGVERVIFIDRNTRNCDPDNLFICSSNSECRKRYNGSLPWPTKSNLSTYGQEEKEKS